MTSTETKIKATVILRSNVIIQKWQRFVVWARAVLDHGHAAQWTDDALEEFRSDPDRDIGGEG